MSQVRAPNPLDTQHPNTELGKSTRIIAPVDSLLHHYLRDATEKRAGAEGALRVCVADYLAKLDAETRLAQWLRESVPASTVQLDALNRLFGEDRVLPSNLNRILSAEDVPVLEPAPY